MKTSVKVITYGILAAIITIIVVFKIVIPMGNMKTEIADLKVQKTKYILAQDELRKVNDTLYTKLVDNTKTEKELRDSLNIARKQKPVVVQNIVIHPNDTISPSTEISLKDSNLIVQDYYPSKEQWFINYTAVINTKTLKPIGEFKFTPLSLQLYVVEDSTGLYRAYMTAPSWVTIDKLDVKTLPTFFTPSKVDNFGWLLGVGVTKNLTTNIKSIEVMGGFRYKKLNILGSANTNNELGVKTLIEF